MAKKRLGGKVAAVRQNAASGGSGGTGAIQQDDDTTPVAQAQPTTTMSASYNAFVGMTDDDKADVISAMTKQGVPAHLSDTDFQKFIYNINLNDKPDLVDDATLNKMSGREMWRTVNSVYDRKNDISYNADQIVRQIQAGRITRTSDNGGSVYGRGLYFADSLRSSTAYGNVSGNVKKTAVVRAKLNSNAKIISYNKATNGCYSEIKSGSKLGKALNKCDHASAVSIYALSKGYNVIDNGMGYLNVLSRQAMSISKTISSK